MRLPCGDSSLEQKTENARNLRAVCRRRTYSENWECVLTAATIPFELPERGVKIVVKVIDQTGMEHMTVIDNPRDLIGD